MEPIRAIKLSVPPKPVDATVRLPGSKSLTNRALVLAAMARGRSQLDAVLVADDTRLMVEALGALGVDARLDCERHRATIDGCGGFWPSGEADIFCGNAGTVMRFLTAACCLGVGEFRLDGSARMRERPLGDLVGALRELGACIECEASEGYCPLVIRANGLRGGRVRFERPVSSQFVSAILMAAPRAANDVMIEIVGDLPSDPFVRMTLGLMEAFGGTAVEEGMRKFIVPGGQSYSGVRYEVEPDATAASYFFGAAAVTGGRVTVEGLGSETRQGDWRFVDVLERMGCRVEREPRRTTVWGPAEGRLRGVDVDLNEMPDVAQTLAVLAAFAEGATHIRNVANLRVKETDRLAALAAELRRMGVEVDTSEDGIVIPGGRPPRAASIETYGDHRMAMSFSLAGLRVDGMVIQEPGCVSKTFPEFFEAWASLAR